MNKPGEPTVADQLNQVDYMNPNAPRFANGVCTPYERRMTGGTTSSENIDFMYQSIGNELKVICPALESNGTCFKRGILNSYRCVKKA